MTDTVRTTAALQTLFADGQLPGSITPQMVRDFIKSFDITRSAVVNVMDAPYNAVADGVTDNTTAFAAAMVALGVLGGGTLLIPAGTFVADPPALVANVRVLGAGKTATTITAATVNGTWLGTDVSNVWLDSFTFTGKSNNGAVTTDHAVYIHAVAADVTDVRITNCAFKQFKSTDSCVRVAGNGDLVTPATKFVKRIIIADNNVTEFYDTNSASLAVASQGIYLFGGIKEAWVERNYVDGTFGKHGIIAQSEAIDVHISGNTVLNCGLTNANFGYGITVYSGYTTANVVDAIIVRNVIKNSARAGIYLAAIGKYQVTNNVLDTCDQFSGGIGTVGSGAIQVNNNSDVAASGVGVVSDNTITDPGFCALYINTGNFQRAECTVTGNTCKMVTAGLTRTACVVYGRGAIIDNNIFRGFTRGVFFNNTLDDEISDLTISNNQMDATGAAGSLIGVIWGTIKRIGPMVVRGNTFRGYTTGVDLRNVTDLTFHGNIFSGSTTCAILNVIRGTVMGNIGDGGTSGMILQLLTGTATAKITVSGNLFAACTTPCTIAENSGVSIVFGNDFGTQPGRAADSGDASIASASNNPSAEVFPWSTTLTANRSLTLSATKCFRGDKKTMVRDAATPGAFTLALVNDLGTTLATIPNSTKGFATAMFDGTNWKLLASGTYA